MGIAKSAMFETVGSALPWLPSVLGTIALATNRSGMSLLVEIGTWSSHSLYWISPLLCLILNTALKRALGCLRMDIAKILRRMKS